MLTKQEILLGKGTWAESRRVREPRRIALPGGCSLRFYSDGISFYPQPTFSVTAALAASANQI